ncbi:hypothetical protein [Brucella endophytica]|uniref:hypothetical protein n=1 Tax=Brucella endophytica TaxID=1963359 RepID=UPI0016671748|nr:hypothetical protein [Brucella endophytica]
MDPSDKHWDDGVKMFPALLDMSLPSGEVEDLIANSKATRHPSACHWDPFLSIFMTTRFPTRIHAIPSKHKQL